MQNLQTSSFFSFLLFFFLPFSLSLPSFLLSFHLSFSLSFFISFVRFIYLKGIFSKTVKREEKRDLSTGLLPRCHNTWDWAMLKSGEKELHPCFLHGCRDPRIWTVFHCFPRHISKELDWKWSKPGVKPMLLGEADIVNQWPNMLCCNTGPSINTSFTV